ncbi:KANL2-like protein [Mya arenaria]|uniref:KAT8 regulatory NSL complex subunit 2 n=2 Tax=Mya arenaria TaxID=6604 RepID=A0ABY7E713_MYAAR|nr:KANL2-like protein [Mya arenaria]
MFRSRAAFMNSGKSKQPVEGLFCMYNHRVCMQNRLEGYEYCLKHILEDKNAPFKQCSYVSSKSSKRCTAASPKSDRKDGYCVEHARRALLLRQRNSRKKRPKESPEMLLEGLDHHLAQGRGYFTDMGDSRRHPSVASKALDYASSSDSDAETPVVDQAWRGDGDSDAESIDSELEDPLKHAGVYTAEEVALVMRDKLIRLQSLYIEQFKRLQHVMKERRRKYLHSVDKEREQFGAVGQYARDLDNHENWSRYTAMKRYHRRYGTEALLHRQSKERRIAASDGSNYKPPVHPKCVHTIANVKCQERTLPLSKYCLHHIMEDPHQVLYRPCSFGDGTCGQPVASQEDIPLCPLHPSLNNGMDSTFGNDSKTDPNTTDDIIDITTDIPMETSQAPSATNSAIMEGENYNVKMDEGQLSEEDLAKKGRLLLEHLKCPESTATK